MKIRRRDFHRSIILSVVLISALYVSVSFVTIGTEAYRSGGSIAPFAAILSNVLGRYGAEGAAILAVFIIFGAANVYTTGMSRVFYAVSKDGGFPKALDHLNDRKVPDRALVTILACALPVFAIYYFFNINLETALLIPSGAAIIVYVIGSAAGVKMLGVVQGETRRIKKRILLPLISLSISLIVLPFVGWFLAVSAAVSFAALIFGWVHSSRNK